MKKILLAILLMMGTINSYADDKGFILDSLESAQQLSELTDKPVLLIFGAEYCVWCEKLKSDILSNKLPETSPYIICYIDIEKNKNLKEKYKISIIPDSRILVKNAQVSQMIGYSSKNYSKWLKEQN